MSIHYNMDGCLHYNMDVLCFLSFIGNDEPRKISLQALLTSSIIYSPSFQASMDTKLQGAQGRLHDLSSSSGGMNPPHSGARFTVYRISDGLLLHTMNDVEAHNDYFVQNRNTSNTIGLSCFQEVAIAFRMLTHEVLADATSEYICIGESIVTESLQMFIILVIYNFVDEYLNHLMRMIQLDYLLLGANGFPVCQVPSIVCTMSRIKNYPCKKKLCIIQC